MIEFSSTWPTCFEEDDSVIRHELGHALVWLASGHNIRELKFVRTGGMQLKAMTSCIAPSNQSDSELISTIPDQLAERFLAGEIASRIYCNLPHNVICSDLPINPASNLDELLASQNQFLQDDIKAFEVARQTANSEWYPWLVERHRNARQVIVDYWDDLDNASDVLYGDIPVLAHDSCSIEGECIRRLLGLV